MRIHLWAVKHLALFVFGLLLLACGGERHRDGVMVGSKDTVSFMARLDTADAFMQRGAVDTAAFIAKEVFDSTDGYQALLDQHMRAVGIIGQARRRRSDPDSAVKLYQEGMRLAEAANDSDWISVMWLNLGVAYDFLGDYERALKAQLEALRWKEALRDSVNLGRVFGNLGGLYWRQERLPEAIAMLRKSVAVKWRFDSLRVPLGLNGIGVVMIDAEEYDSAIVVLRESLALQDRMATGEHRGGQLYNIGLAYEGKGNLDSARSYLDSALAVSRKEQDLDLEVNVLYSLGELLLKSGDLRAARPVLDSSLAFATRTGSMEDLKQTHHSLARLHEAMDDPAKALYHFREQQRYSDSLMTTEKDAAMQELRVQYDTEHQARENEELRAAQDLADLRAERNRWIAMGIGVLAIAIAILGWTIIQRNRQHARQREADLEQQALRLQMDPHFLFNALNTVPGLYASGDATAASDHIGHLSRFLRLVLETSRRRTIPLQQEIELVERYLRISANRRPGAFTWAIKVMPYVQPDGIAIPPMLIQPVVENAIEHGFNGSGHGQLSVLVDRAGSVLHVEVKDNGIGRKAAAERPLRREAGSLGLDLVRKRIALFDKRTAWNEAVEVRDEREADGTAAGTTVILRLRIQTVNEHAALGDR